MNNEIWRAYALAIWPSLVGETREVEVRDASGKPLYDRHGKPQTEWKEYTLDEAWLLTVKYANRFCAEEEAQAVMDEVGRAQMKKERDGEQAIR